MVVPGGTGWYRVVVVMGSVTQVKETHIHITDDLALDRLDAGPLVAEAVVGHGLATGAHLEPALAPALEEEGKEAPVGVGAGAVIALRRGHGRVQGEVVKQPQDALAVGVSGVVGGHESSRRRSPGPGPGTPSASPTGPAPSP